MQCKIKETGQMKVLSIKDSNGIDFTEDFIGNYNALEGFKYNSDDYHYEVSEEAFNWWERVINNQKQLMDFTEDLKKQFVKESKSEDEYLSKLNDLQMLIDAESGTDLEDYARNLLNSLKRKYN